MNLNQLKEMYRDFVEFHRKEFKKNVKNRVGIDKVKNFSENLVEEVFENYEKISFLRFSLIIRDLWFYENPFLIIKKFNHDSEFLTVFLKFLIKKRIAVIKSEKVKFKIKLNEIFSIPLTEDKIIEKIKKIIGKINLKKSVIENFGIFYNWKGSYDQIPINLKSSIFLASKITEFYPFKEKFVFVGADDFVYLILSLINKEFRFKVFDIDEDLLNIVCNLKEKLNANIEIEKRDIRKKYLDDKFYGVYINPPYNFSGLIAFLRFSSKIIEKDGGICFLVLGDEAIGNRMLFFQEHITKMNFIIRDIEIGKISYLFQKIHKECFIFEKNFKKFGLNIENKEYLNASLYILEKIPFKPKKIKIFSEIYSYL
ncbi:MAG: bis-aminopropyl spermidine synthase family protein [Candidatus Aenigmatarchaeota archaeon]